MTDVELPEIMGSDTEHRSSNGPVPAEAKADWFSAGEEGELEWPAFARPRRDRDADRKPSDTSESVRHLFPVPDVTDWEIGELRYDRKRAR